MEDKKFEDTGLKEIDEVNSTSNAVVYIAILIAIIGLGVISYMWFNNKFPIYSNNSEIVSSLDSEEKKIPIYYNSIQEMVELNKGRFSDEFKDGVYWSKESDTRLAIIIDNPMILSFYSENQIFIKEINRDPVKGESLIALIRSGVNNYDNYLVTPIYDSEIIQYYDDSSGKSLSSWLFDTVKFSNMKKIPSKYYNLYTFIFNRADMKLSRQFDTSKDFEVIQYYDYDNNTVHLLEDQNEER